MAQTIQLKRSAVQGKTPLIADLSLGEIAINTYDGKLFIKRNNGTDSIVELSTALNAQPLDADLTAIAALAGNSGFLKKTAADTWALDTNTYLTGNQSITVSGDASGTGTTAISLTLANSGVSAGTYKSVTVDVKGRVTGGTNPTTLAGYGITDAQALDADLTAIAALAGTSGFLKKTAADTWALDTTTYLTGHPTIAGATSVNNSGLTYIQDLTFDSNGHVTGQVSAAIQSASTSQQGVVQLSDSTSTTSSTVAATSTAVKSAYDLAAAALPKSGGSMTGSIVIPTGSKITLTDAPVIGTDAVNKNYVDSNLAGLSWKNSVKVATTANITLSATQTIDGVAVVAGDRVLVKNQTSTAENGIYVVAAGAWTRATDMDSTTPINEVNSSAVFVEQGTQADTGWTQINAVSTLGTDAVSFTQFNGAAGITAGIGLLKTGNTLDIQLGAGIAQLPTDEVGVDVYTGGGLMTTVDGTASSTVTGAQLSLTKVGTAGTYKSVTTDAYGRITAGTNPTTLAGYGITDAQALDADLTAIAALAGTSGFLKKTAADTWALDTSTYLTSYTETDTLATVTGRGATTTTPIVINANSASDALRITQAGAGNALVVEDSTNPDSTPFVIDTNGNLTIGYATGTYKLNVKTDSYSEAALDGVLGGYLHFRRVATSQASPTIVASGNVIGQLVFEGYDGSAYKTSATIDAIVDNTPGTNDMPGRLVFSTTADGASTPTERMRIDSIGNVGIGGTATTGYTFDVKKNVTGAVNAGNIVVSGIIQSDVTSSGKGFATYLQTAAATFTLGNLNHFEAQQGVIGAGSTVTNQAGFIASSNLTGATNNYGFYGNIAAGTGRYNLYMAGTADNYLAGKLGLGTLPVVNYGLLNTLPITGGANAWGIASQGTVQSDVTGTMAYFRTGASTVAATFTLGDLIHYHTTQGTIGAGSSVVNQYGFYAQGSLTGATNNYGFYSNIASGTGRYNFYANGTAANYFAGATTIGSMLTLTNTSAQSLTDGALWANGASGAILFDDAAQKRISWNDGSGNFNIRAGNYYNGTSVLYTKGTSDANGGAAAITLANDAVDGSISLNASVIGTPGTAVSWGNSVNITPTQMTISAGTTSTSTSTGALVVSGGAGIAGNTYVGGNLSVTGNLTINGTTTTVNSTTVTVDDPIITLGGDTAPAADDNKDRGVEFRWHNGTAAKVGFFGFDDSTGKFTFIPDATNTSEVFSGTQGTISANVLESTVATGTAPLAVTSTTVVTNLNADMLDGKHVGTSGNAIPLLDGTNTWSSKQSFTNLNTIFGTELSSQYLEIAAATNFPYLDFHSSNTAVDYNARISCSGATAGLAAGDLTFESANASFTGNISSSKVITASKGINPGAVAYPIYEANVDFGAAVANTWVKIVGASLANTAYSTIGFIIEVIDPQANHAIAASVNAMIKETYHVACVRAESTTADTPDACYVSGPSNRIRAIKTAVGAYEVQIQNLAQYREYKIRISTYASNASHTIDYFNGATAGTATATYTAASGASVDYFQNINVVGTITGNSLTSNSISTTNGNTTSATLTTSATTANQVVMNHAIATYRSVQYQIQVTSSTSYHSTIVNVIHDGTTAYITEYGTILTGSSLATFDADISGGNLRLLVTPTNAVSTIKVIASAINI